jgi:hypothetical protein
MTLVSDGFNLAGDGSCNLNQTSDTPNGTAALSPLALNAPGATATHAIGADSDAYRRIPQGTNDCGGIFPVDQRGVARPSADWLCDVGAYETDTPLVCEPPYAPVTEAELNEAIACVNAAGAGSHTITLGGNISLTSSTLALDNPLASGISIQGNGRTIDGAGSGTIFTIEAETSTTINNVFLTGGQGARGPGGNWGGGIFNRGELILTNSALFGNEAAFGAGIVNLGDGSIAELTISDTTLSDNLALTAGGAIHNSAVNGGTASLNIVNSTLSGNSAGAGGGIFGEGNGGNAGANVVYATLADNTAVTGGGGIHVSAPNGNASITLNATIIANGPGGSPDCARPSGALISIGYNLASDDSCNLTQGSDLPSAEANLLPLALNPPGGTATHALGSNSQAVDRVPNGAVGCGTAILADQRDAPRPQPADGLCDIGAFERGPADASDYRLYLPVGLNP